MEAFWGLHTAVYSENMMMTDVKLLCYQPIYQLSIQCIINRKSVTQKAIVVWMLSISVNKEHLFYYERCWWIIEWIMKVLVHLPGTSLRVLATSDTSPSTTAHCQTMPHTLVWSEMRSAPQSSLSKVHVRQLKVENQRSNINVSFVHQFECISHSHYICACVMPKVAS